MNIGSSFEVPVVRDARSSQLSRVFCIKGRSSTISHTSTGPARRISALSRVTGCCRFTALGPRPFERRRVDEAPSSRIERMRRSNRRRRPDRVPGRHLGIVGNEGRAIAHRQGRPPASEHAASFNDSHRILPRRAGRRLPGRHRHHGISTPPSAVQIHVRVIRRPRARISTAAADRRANPTKHASARPSQRRSGHSRYPFATIPCVHFPPLTAPRPQTPPHSSAGPSE
jgi:hypothetical protein